MHRLNENILILILFLQLWFSHFISLKLCVLRWKMKEVSWIESKLSLLDLHIHDALSLSICDSLIQVLAVEEKGTLFYRKVLHLDPGGVTEEAKCKSGKFLPWNSAVSHGMCRDRNLGFITFILADVTPINNCLRPVR